MNLSLRFLKRIIKNNNTLWMQAHKEEFVAAKKEFEFLVQELIVRIGEWDENMPNLEPKDCTFRFNRDIRFSDNKSPYKENFGAWISTGGKKGNKSGYYFNLSPKEIFVAGGIWHPEAADLKSIRHFLMEEGQEFIDIMAEKKFKKIFGTLNTNEQLKRPPLGYPKDHEFIDLLKFKSFTVSSPFTVEEATAPNFGKKINERFKLLKPFNDYLNRAVQHSSS